MSLRPHALLGLPFLLIVLDLRDEDEPVRFEDDVRPILKENCYRCHGEERSRSGLRLDLEERAREGGYSGEPAIVPGDSAASELARRIRSEDEDFRMPPPERPRLSPEDVELLVRWIDEGASFEGAASGASVGGEGEPKHWAYAAPTRPALPAAGPREDHPIDAFVRARLAEEGLEPSPEADRATLIRRIALDLTGLPPTPEEIDAFLADGTDGAYERCVDRFLSSPHFGERWGRHWLDLARYSDSDGGGYDVERSMWPYRDWVIRALNEDKPFDEFTIEQLAGDLLPEATRAQRIATGFHRNTMIQQEGGADDEEYRVEAVKDRVQTTGAVWLGANLLCAQCHDHKYDPISQRDYYRMYAIFNQTRDGGRSTHPWLELPTEEEAAELERVDAELAELEREIESRSESVARDQPRWEAEFLAHAGGWTVLRPSELEATRGPDLLLQSDDSVLVQGELRPRSRYTVTAHTPLEGITALRLEALKDERVEFGGPGRGHEGNFVLSAVRVTPLAAAVSKEAAVPIASATADFSAPEWPIEAAVDGVDSTGWGVEGRTETSHEAVFAFEQPLPPDPGGGTTLRIVLEHGAGMQLTLGRFRLAATTTSPAPSPRAYSFDLAEVLRIPLDERTDDQLADVRAHYLGVSPGLGKLRERRADLAAQRPRPVTTLVMSAVDEPRESFVHVRGDFLKKGAPVEPGVPAILPQLPDEDTPADRLDLARWLVARGNPLTARVVVNRWWQRLFGRGLVATQNDFGTQGSLPTHPELLDWLAVELMESGWRTKRMLRLIVTSKTYRQASAASPEQLEHDPDNVLLARQSRLRLEGEAIRDSALAASGALDRRIGGPSVHPPLPEFISVRTFEGKWPTSRGPDRFRRGIYTWHWRTSPYPFLTLFDGPNGTTTCTRRTSANNALQALAMANDPMLFELAQHLALRIVREGGEDASERIASAFRWCLGRPVTASELSTLEAFYLEQLESFASDPEGSRAAAPADLPGDLSPSEAAAWTAVARVLFNLDEFITRA